MIADQTTGSRTYTTRYDISLSQTLFDLSAWFDWKAGSERSKQAEATVAAAQQNLIVRVSEAYFGVLRAQDNLRAAKAQERALARQLEQTRQRFNVGLIAITDVYEAEARHDLAGVTRIVEENNVAVALERLSVLTGQQHGQLQLLSDEFTPELPMPTIALPGWTSHLRTTTSWLRCVSQKKRRVKTRSLDRWDTHLESVLKSATPRATQPVP